MCATRYEWIVHAYLWNGALHGADEAPETIAREVFGYMVGLEVHWVHVPLTKRFHNHLKEEDVVVVFSVSVEALHNLEKCVKEIEFEVLFVDLIVCVFAGFVHVGGCAVGICRCLNKQECVKRMHVRLG